MNWAGTGFVAIILSAHFSLAAAPVVDVFEPETLYELDRPDQFSLNWVLEEEASPSDSQNLPQVRLDRLFRNGKYKAIVDTVTADIAALKKEHPKIADSVIESYKKDSDGNVARHFDTRWLSSKYAAFPLIGVVNRIDRKDFAASGCGELRFIYRLAYEVPSREGNDRSMFPVFLNAVYEYTTDDCRKIAEDWIAPASDQTPAARLDWLLKGALDKRRLRFKQLELNMQAIRFPSGQKTDFGGQAVYLLRIFEKSGSTYKVTALENMPNVSALLADRTGALKTALVSQLTDEENLRAIDQGTFVLKNTEGKVLADIALSYSTSGRARLANKPFSVLAQDPDIRKKLEAIDFARLKREGKLKFVTSAEGLLERLNNMTCSGCHQASGTAGFHVLGGANKYNVSFSQVVLPFSPHYYAEQSRRKYYVAETAAGNEANLNKFRPHSAFPPAAWSNGDRLPGFGKVGLRDVCISANPHLSVPVTCAGAHTECLETARNSRLAVEFGECVVKSEQESKVFAGLACRQGKVEDALSALSGLDAGKPFNLKSYADRMTGLRGAIDADSSKLYGGSVACGKPVGGVPLGRISKQCQENTSAGLLDFLPRLRKNSAIEQYPSEFCAMRGGTHFDLCAKQCNPVKCLTETAPRRSMLDLCGMGRFCREDYICQQLPVEIADQYRGSQQNQMRERIEDLNGRQIGFCTPNYFVFNMRIDGRVLPGTNGCQ